jgi:hypothetical protein
MILNIFLTIWGSILLISLICFVIGEILKEYSNCSNFIWFQISFVLFIFWFGILVLGSFILAFYIIWS